MTNSRRTFLKRVVALSAASFAVIKEDQAAAYALGLNGDTAFSKPNIGWYERPMRWAQLSFVESDPGNYDPAFWLDYFKKIHADATVLNAGGCVAFNPTRIPFNYRSKWLGNGDAFGDLARSCRALGMNVVARTDAHACHSDINETHPDWLAVDAEGNKRRHPSDPDFWLTCALGPYNFEFMTSVHEEIMRDYMPDGIFTNRWAGSGMCYCVHCQTNFRNFPGLDLPRTLDPQNPSRRQYIVWHQMRLFELWRLWNSRIQQINPNASFIPNTGGGALSELDMKIVGEQAPTLLADRQGRAGLMPPWANGKSAKEFRSTMAPKAVAGIFGVGLEDKYRWKDSVQSGDEVRVWVADGIAHGFRPTFTKFNARPFDKRWFLVVQEIFDWHFVNENYFRNQESYARVGMVYSQQTAAFYGGPDASAKVEDASLGFYQALIEARIPFEMVHDRLLDREHISHLRTLIFPNIAALSLAQCDQISEFVQRGGGIVASFETSLYDEWGVQRRDFGLNTLFGASFAGTIEGPMHNSYLSLERGPVTAQYHPLLAGFEDAGRIINGINRVYVTPAGQSEPSPLRVVPTYPDLPMEECFPRPVKTHDAGVFVRTIGRGRAIYFPWDIGRSYWEVLDAGHAKLLRNAVLWATNEQSPLEVQVRGLLDISLLGQENSMTAHLVNLTNPMMMKGPIREIVPISKQTIRVRIPVGRRVAKVRLLVSGSEVPYREEDGMIAVEVPSIDVHEVVAFDFGT